MNIRKTFIMLFTDGLDVAEKHVDEHFKLAKNMTSEQQEAGFSDIKEVYYTIYYITQYIICTLYAQCRNIRKFWNVPMKRSTLPQ